MDNKKTMYNNKMYKSDQKSDQRFWAERCITRMNSGVDTVLDPTLVPLPLFIGYNQVTDHPFSILEYHPFTITLLPSYYHITIRLYCHFNLTLILFCDLCGKSVSYYILYIILI